MLLEICFQRRHPRESSIIDCSLGSVKDCWSRVVRSGTRYLHIYACISFDWEYQSSCTNVHSQIKLNRVLVCNQASSIVDAIVPLQCPQGIRFGICQACQDHVESMASTWRQADRSTTMHPQSHSRTSTIDPTFTIPIDRARTHSLIHSWIHWG